MKTKEIRDLIEFISKTGLNEVNIETEELKISIKRSPDIQAAPIMEHRPQAQAAAPAPLPAAPNESQKSEPAKEAAPAPKSASGTPIKSPMIGTFYRSANPDSPPLVSVGDKVTKGQTVCIIEAMKLFNEIESEVSGTVTQVLVENASPVEFDQSLFVVDPD